MDNYLSHRWPDGPGVRCDPDPYALYPNPLEEMRAAMARCDQKKKRRRKRILVTVFCACVSLALLGGICFYSFQQLAGYMDGLEAASERPRYSHAFPSLFPEVGDWTTGDLPWGLPDPAVKLSLNAAEEDPLLPAREIYQSILPSIIYIEAETDDGYNTGSGVIVTSTGYALTNYHIIDESTKIRVLLVADQSSYYNAEVIGFDEDFDIAVLKFEAKGLVPAPLGDSDALLVGDIVYAVGNPMGYLQGSMTDGIVSALGRDNEVDGNGMGYIQTSAALNPGNSGGALVNEQGQLVGITSAKITGLVLDKKDGRVEDAAVIEGIGLALPTSDILPFVNHILATGKSCRPAIGITCAQIKKNGRSGIEVRSVDKGVPAEAAGLEEGDFIITANGQIINNLIDLRRVLYRSGVDGVVNCQVLRNGEELTISFALIDNLEKDDS